MNVEFENFMEVFVMKENKKDLNKVTGGFGDAPESPKEPTGTMKVIDEIQGKRNKVDSPRSPSPLCVPTPIPSDDEHEDN